MSFGVVILIVDDESGIREFLQIFLSARGFEVLSAASGEEALELWSERADEIKLLLTDMVMPGLNGKALADRIRAQRPGLPVIFMSGYLPEAIAEETLDAPFLKKPFSPIELLERINQILESSSPGPAI